MAAGGITLRAKIRARKPGAKRSTWSSMACVISAVEPCATWQYAHAVCFPAGARRRLNNVCCTSKTNGRPVWLPSHSAISSIVPPRCTVAARAHSFALHGMGASSAQSNLKAPGP